MEWLTEFPDLGTSTLRNIRLTVDGAFRDLPVNMVNRSRLLFEPVKWFLI
jgi:glycine betaine/proline transport system permease protein